MQKDNNSNRNIPVKISLDGSWRFAYTQGGTSEEIPVIPDDESFCAQMPVPSYWDDNTDAFIAAGLWPECRFNPDYRKMEFPVVESQDASLPYIVGIGWYKRQFMLWGMGDDYVTTLSIGGVVTEAWIWINGHLAGYHFGYSTPFEIRIDKYAKAGRTNELVIAVSNLQRDRIGCATRGFTGFSAGIYRSVHIKHNRCKSIKSCYVYPERGSSRLNWQIELEGGSACGNLVLSWKVMDPDTNSGGQGTGGRFVCPAVMNGELNVSSSHLTMTTSLEGISPWSDTSPKLYQIELELLQGNETLDTLKQSFGLRRMECCGNKLELNGSPVFLRGATEHCYFPLTCNPPADKESYLEIIKKLKQLGFNWLRFHTWVPSEEYMQAADQLGMMIQVEPPKGFQLEELRDILLVCRRHPSVLIYCCGNEELLDEAKISYLRTASLLVHELAPDALFNPQEALRGVEYGWNDSDMGTGLTETPFLHNAGRLKSLKEFSDVFGQWTWGLLSYSSSRGDWRTIDERLSVYERPCLSHELGIYGSYMDLNLERRYSGTRIGTDLYASVREHLQKEGVISKADIYYRNSCLWLKHIRKHNLETARKCRNIAGYDYLGAIDYHWHRYGYPCGIMNEFYELKPGETIADVLKYNSESVLLLEYTNKRNFCYGQRVSFNMLASLYGKEALEKGVLSWQLADGEGEVYAFGKLDVGYAGSGDISDLGELAFTVPHLDRPAKLTIYAGLHGDGYNVVNDWDIWAFPAVETDDIKIEKAGTEVKGYENLKIVSRIDESTLEFLNNGGRVILLGSEPFKAVTVSFQPMSAGRPYGNFATVIYEHPALNGFPHEGYCDWQFYSMMEDGRAVVFDECGLPFDPVIEIAGSFKSVQKQASMFEARVGRGALLVFAFRLDTSDAAGAYMLQNLIRYAVSESFAPVSVIKVDVLCKLIENDCTAPKGITTDQAFDSNAQLGGDDLSEA